MAEKNGGGAKDRPENAQVPSIRPPMLWYLFLMLIILWMWQDAFRQVALRTIPYSEFKARLGRGEVTECTVEQDEITGKITPKPRTGAAPPDKAKASTDAPFAFRSVRVEDPKLVEDLQKAGSSSAGCAPGSCRSSSGPGCCRSARSRCSGGCWRGGSARRASPSSASARAGRG